MGPRVGRRLLGFFRSRGKFSIKIYSFDPKVENEKKKVMSRSCALPSIFKRAAQTIAMGRIICNMAYYKTLLRLPVYFRLFFSFFDAQSNEKIVDLNVY